MIRYTALFMKYKPLSAKFKEPPLNPTVFGKMMDSQYDWKGDLVWYKTFEDVSHFGV